MSPPRAASRSTPPTAAAGYSGTPLPKKLGIREGSRVLLLGAPKGFEDTLGVLPPGARTARRAAAADLVLLFAGDRSALEKGLPGARKAMGERGNVWIAWPKKASGVVTDLTEDAVRRAGLAVGLVDFKVCAIDAVWSGLRFAWRKK